jgi:SAM-dependent methyltransferase
MQLDVSDLKAFYATALGQTVRRVLTHRIRARWRGLGGATLIGLGYATPYLGAFRGEARRIGALMPEAQGALVWPLNAPTQSVLVQEDRLPLADGSVDRLLAVHCIEMAERARPLLREIWRVLAPEGRLMLVVPNRRGVWARLDNTPFGQGRPYSRRQLEALLVEAMFTPFDWGGALFMPPVGRRMLLRSATAWERMGAVVSPAFSGVVIAEARKELVAPIGKPAKARALRGLVPAGTRATSRARSP